MRMDIASRPQVVEVAGMLQGLEWVTLEDSKHWGIDATTIDLAFTVREELQTRKALPFFVLCGLCADHGIFKSFIY